MRCGTSEAAECTQLAGSRTARECARAGVRARCCQYAQHTRTLRSLPTGHVWHGSHVKAHGVVHPDSNFAYWSAGELHFRTPSEHVFISVSITSTSGAASTHAEQICVSLSHTAHWCPHVVNVSVALASERTGPEQPAVWK